MARRTSLKKGWLLGFICLAWLLASIPAWASQKPLLVGVGPFAPFVMLDHDRKPSGFSVDLWRAVAGELSLDYLFIPSGSVAGAYEDVVQRRVDLALGGLAITEQREHMVDFTHAYFHTGLGILVTTDRSWSLLSALGSLFTTDRLALIAGLLAFMILAGHAIWLAERGNRRPDSRSFDRNYFPGVFQGMYWAVVTASTVGYGDHAPRSWVGRLLAILLIVISLPLFGYFIAQLSSNITLHEIRTSIAGPQDLIERRVGVVEGSDAQEYMSRLNAVTHSFDSIENAYKWLLGGRLDAVVYARPNLRHFANTSGRGRVEVVGRVFAPQDYGMAVPQGSPLRERVNRILLAMHEDGRLEDIRGKWFGGEK
jgi:ABC-type amino acid transport substrate-binding protein